MIVKVCFSQQQSPVDLDHLVIAMCIFTPERQHSTIINESWEPQAESCRVGLSLPRL